MSPPAPKPRFRPEPATYAPVPVPGDGAPRVISSEEVLGGRGQVWIRHGGDLYRLQRTRQGKLILTK